MAPVLCQKLYRQNLHRPNIGGNIKVWVSVSYMVAIVTRVKSLHFSYCSSDVVGNRRVANLVVHTFAIKKKDILCQSSCESVSSITCRNLHIIFTLLRDSKCILHGWMHLALLWVTTPTIKAYFVLEKIGLRPYFTQWDVKAQENPRKIGGLPPHFSSSPQAFAPLYSPCACLLDHSTHIGSRLDQLKSRKLKGCLVKAAETINEKYLMTVVKLRRDWSGRFASLCFFSWCQF